MLDSALSSLLHVTHQTYLLALAIMTSPIRYVKSFWHASSPEPGKGTAKVTFRGEQIEVVKGELLRTALMRRGLTPHNGSSKNWSCRGMAACGTCAVHIKKGKVHPDHWNIHEQMRLRLPPFTGKHNRDDLRLACQVEVVEDIEVLKCDGLWGQGSEPSKEPPQAFKAPLGEVEYILDCAQSGFRRPKPKLEYEKRE